MNVQIRVTKNFKRQAKSLIKKYPSLLGELKTLEKDLYNNPKLGNSLGFNCYKIRLAVKSKGKGKSGGLRVISYLQTEIISIIDFKQKEQLVVYLILIYDKSETTTISDKELKALIESIE